METLVRSSIISIIAYVVLSFLLVSSSFAATTILTSIGGIAFLDGSTEFWVTNSQPTFVGTSVAGGPVDITINALTENVIADASGNWTYTPQTVLSGSNDVFIADVNDFVTFSLTISTVPASQSSTSESSSPEPASGSASTLPSAGAPNPLVVFTLGGMLLVIIGTTGLKISSRK